MRTSELGRQECGDSRFANRHSNVSLSEYFQPVFQMSVLDRSLRRGISRTPIRFVYGGAVGHGARHTL